MTGSCERALVLFLRGIRIASPVKVAKIIDVFHRPRICHRYHRLYRWRKFCHVEKFQISVKNLNNLWRFIEIYAVFVLNLCGEKSLSRKNDKYEVWIFSASRLTKNNRLQPNQIEVRRPGLRFGGNYIHG